MLCSAFFGLILFSGDWNTIGRAKSMGTPAFKKIYLQAVHLIVGHLVTGEAVRSLNLQHESTRSARFRCDRALKVER
jgi:hypothetical protein